MSIKANTCPYCDGHYGIAWGGCENQCRTMRVHQQLVQDAIDAEVTEDMEVTGDVRPQS